MDALNEMNKSKQHLDLLREEYVKLQQRYKTLEQNYNLLNSTTKLDQNSFVCRLLRIVAELFNKELYRFEQVPIITMIVFIFSDIKIKLDGETLFGHRFILSARTSKWDPQYLSDAIELDLSGGNSSRCE